MLPYVLCAHALKTSWRQCFNFCFHLLDVFKEMMGWWSVLFTWIFTIAVALSSFPEVSAHPPIISSIRDFPYLAFLLGQFQLKRAVLFIFLHLRMSVLSAFLKGVSVRYRSLGQQDFPSFDPLQTFCTTSLWPSCLLMRNVVIQLVPLLRMTWFFPLAAQDLYFARGFAVWLWCIWVWIS